MIQEQEVSIEQQDIEPTNVLIQNKADLQMEDEFLRQEAEKWRVLVEIKTSDKHYTK